VLDTVPSCAAPGVLDRAEPLKPASSQWPGICCGPSVQGFRFGAFSALFLAAGLWVAGCGNSADPDPHADGQACSTDANCGDGERCELDVYPRIMAVCRYAPCGTEGECPDGLACIPPPPNSQTPGWGGCKPLVCAPGCADTGCPAGLFCRASGLCDLRKCDEPGAAACPEHWRCDPPAATTEPSEYQGGSVIEDTLESRDSIARGCVRLRCDEPDGYACKEFWECAPGETQGGSGCVPIPCRESGHCEYEDFICEPTSMAPRRPGTDSFGCVFRNCEEGQQCLPPILSEPWVVYCDPSAANADDNGCALRTCAEGNPCGEGYVCEPDSPEALRTGCVPGPSGSGGSMAIGGGRCVTR
jgi:hypothetical protein